MKTNYLAAEKRSLWVERLFIFHTGVIVFSLFFFFTEAIGLKQLFYYLNRHPTLSTSGRVIRSEVKWRVYSDGAPGHWVHSFAYVYYVDGIEYTSRNIFFSKAYTIKANNLWATAGKYKAGTTRKVYYLKNYPHYSALINRWSGQWESVCNFFILITIVVSYRFTYKLRSRLKVPE